MELTDKIKNAGVVGAGGAGFPTHVKVNAKAEYVLANGAECEPLLRGDQLLMQNRAAEVVEGMNAVMEITGAKFGFICLKEKYHGAVDALKDALKENRKIKLFFMRNYYPAGDEQQLVFDVTGRTVPTGGLPLDVGAVVCNVATLINISAALKDKPVTIKYLTVGGNVKKPCTFAVPIGTSIRTCLEYAGIVDPTDQLICGGPMMGYLEADWDKSVTKTTGGLLLLPKDHRLVVRRRMSMDNIISGAAAICCQCSMCTQLCPRNALGLDVQPHKVMRSFAFGGKGAGSNGIFSCCNCGICTNFACDFGLDPARVMTELKNKAMASGVKPEKKVAYKADSNREYVKLPVPRLMTKLGLKQYDVDAPLIEGPRVKRVYIPLRQHIGAPGEVRVQNGAKVSAGDLIASIPEGKLGANIHASITGTITAVDENGIEITA